MARQAHPANPVLDAHLQDYAALWGCTSQDALLRLAATGIAWNAMLKKRVVECDDGSVMERGPRFATEMLAAGVRHAAAAIIGGNIRDAFHAFRPLQ